MSRAIAPVSGRPYGLAAVCRVWRIARSGVYRHQVPAASTSARRPGPTGPMADAALVEKIRAVLATSPFHGEGHRKVWARLRYQGVRTSRRRVLRLMREHRLLAPCRAGAPRGPKTHDGTIVPGTVDTMWGTDLTTTWTGQGQPPCSSPSITARPNVSASTLLAAPRAWRPWSRSGRACVATSAASPRASRGGSRCATTMARNTCQITSRKNSASSASKAHRPSSARLREMAVLNGSSEL